MPEAALLHGPRDIRIETLPDVVPGTGELLLDVTAVGICGSDLHTYLHGEIGGIAAESPLILGHEAAGRVAALGPGTDDRFDVGQSVAIDPGLPCGDLRALVLPIDHQMHDLHFPQTGLQAGLPKCGTAHNE